MRNNFIITTLLLAGFISCKQEISYQAPTFAEQHPVKVKVLNDQYLFRFAYQPLVYDSLLIVGDMNESANICIFNRYSGQLVKAFGPTGNGPGELVTPTAYSLDYDNGYLYVCDYGQRSVFEYDLKNWDHKTLPTTKKIHLNSPLGDCSQIIHLKDSLFIAKNLFNRFIVGTQGTFSQKILSPTPDPTHFPTDKDWYALTNSYSCDVASPSGHKFASATLFGGILEIYNVNGNQLSSPTYHYFYEPILDKNDIVYRPNQETIYGFCHLSASDKYLYATVHGKKDPKNLPSSILKFDWDGNPIAEYTCDNISISSFTVDEKAQLIYVIAYNSEYEQILGVIPLNE